MEYDRRGQQKTNYVRAKVVMNFLNHCFIREHPHT